MQWNVRKVMVVFVTQRGLSLAERLKHSMPQNFEVEVISKNFGSPVPLPKTIEALWSRYDAFVFIMAAGIVVRLIAPFLKSKWTDPAVVAVDEGGNFAISLAGGHWGGANALAREVAACLGATPVITTATDVQGRPAVDVLARHLGFLPVPLDRVKAANSALLSGRQVVFYSEWGISRFISGLSGVEILPLEFFCLEAERFSVFITSRLMEVMSKNSLQLCPPSLVAGVGCKRGVSVEEVEFALKEALILAGRREESLAYLATHSVKAEEAALLAFAKKRGLPVAFLRPEILERVREERPEISESRFVREKVGVGCVCETAALAVLPEGELILGKKKFGKVTVALVEAISLWSASGPVIRRT